MKLVSRGESKRARGNETKKPKRVGSAFGVRRWVQTPTNFVSRQFDISPPLLMGLLNAIKFWITNTNSILSNPKSNYIKFPTPNCIFYFLNLPLHFIYFKFSYHQIKSINKLICHTFNLTSQLINNLNYPLTNFLSLRMIVTN